MPRAKQVIMQREKNFTMQEETDMIELIAHFGKLSPDDWKWTMKEHNVLWPPGQMITSIRKKMPPCIRRKF